MKSKVCLSTYVLYRVSGLKPHNKTQEDIWAEMFIREIKDIDDDEVEIPAMDKYKIDHWPLTKKKTWLNMSSLDHCAGSDEVFRDIRKSKNNIHYHCWCAEPIKRAI